MEEEVKVLSDKVHAVRFYDDHPLYPVREDLFAFVKALVSPLGVELEFREWDRFHNMRTEEVDMDCYGIIAKLEGAGGEG